MNPELKNSEQEINYDQLAEELNEIQKGKNGGNGVDCVRTIVNFLKLNQINTARAVCFNEGDKIIKYSDIKEWIKDNLFKKGEKHPWSTFERLQKGL